MIQWLSGFIDRLFVVAGALVFSQAPQYFNQYMHRLTGHSEELKIHIRSIQQAAAKNGLELPEYLGTFTRHQDSIINSHGILMEEMFSRYSALSQASLALQESTPLTRPFIFIRHLNLDIAKATVLQFQPGLLLTTEGVVYAIAGMGIGYALFQLIKFIVSPIFKKRIEKKI